MLNKVNSGTLHAKEYLVNKYASISFIPASQIAICTVNAAYIPMADFTEVFTKVGELIKKEKITKLIFDKRKMTIFHQPSMEWYHLIWKEEMYEFGLVSHRKLLPDDKLFEQSVITGRKKIARENPHFSFEKFDIRYCNSLEEAINK